MISDAWTLVIAAQPLADGLTLVRLGADDLLDDRHDAVGVEPQLLGQAGDLRRSGRWSRRSSVPPRWTPGWLPRATRVPPAAPAAAVVLSTFSSASGSSPVLTRKRLHQEVLLGPGHRLVDALVTGVGAGPDERRDGLRLLAGVAIDAQVPSTVTVVIHMVMPELGLVERAAVVAGDRGVQDDVVLGEQRHDCCDHVRFAHELVVLGLVGALLLDGTELAHDHRRAWSRG